MPDGFSNPEIRTPIPGPRSRAWVDRLARHECPAITARRARRASALGTADDDPVVFERARGANIVCVDGNVLVDMTAGFGVAAVGHRHPAVVAAVKAQADRLLHAMGDAHPDTQRITLLELLAERTGFDKAILGSSGSDAVEAALKTARIATGRDGVVSFSGAYHGLSYGALTATAYHRAAFRGPFAAQLGGHSRVAPFGGSVPDLSGVGAVIVEPIQGRGGMRAPPPGWLAELRSRCRAAGALLIFDEIFTGFGRTGEWFRFQEIGVTPDILCVGKAMAGGMPLSACLGTSAVMDAWGASRGEAIHTQTFLGHPPGCAAALAAIPVLGELIAPARALGAWLRGELQARGWGVRGAGLMLGVEVPEPLRVSRALLQRGYLALPAGEDTPVLGITPPLVITRSQLEGFLEALDAVCPPGPGR